MDFFIKVNSKYRTKLRFMVEDRLIELKGRNQLNKDEYGFEPADFIIQEITELEDLLSQLKEKSELIQSDSSIFTVLNW